MYRKVFKNKYTLLLLLFMMIFFLPVFFMVSCSTEEPEKPERTVELSLKTYDENVSIEGVDVSGLSMEEARQKLQDKTDGLLNNKITFTVETPGDPLEYSFRLDRLNVTIDQDKTLQEAYKFRNPSGEPVDFTYTFDFDDYYIMGLLEGLEEEYDWGVKPVNSSYKVKTYSDESNLTTGGVLERTEPEDGYEIDLEQLLSSIKEKIQNRDFGTFAAPVTYLSGRDEASEVGEMVLMGRYRTSFESSSEGRRYNIWKISEKLNGAKLYAGDVFSLNDYVGERNEENGWAVAYGIEDGIYTEQYGGGICQVSSTFYNATLRAEMKPVNRIPHTIAASYVPKGMDATISTGGPDYKVENVLDTNMYVIVTCNGPESWVQVEIYGTKKRDYELEFWSELIEEKDKPAPVYERNSSLGEYEIKEVRPGQKGEKWEVYRKKTAYDGTVIEEKEPVTTSTYEPIAPKYQLGSGIPLPADGTPLADVKASIGAGGNPSPLDSGV